MTCYIIKIYSLYHNDNHYFIFRFIYQIRLAIGGITMRDFLRLIGEQLQPLDVDELKYILQDSFTGTF